MTLSVDPKFKELLEKKEKKIADFIFDECFAAQIKSSQLKSAEVATKETRAMVTERIHQVEKENAEAIRLFKSSGSDSQERDHVEEIFNKYWAQCQSLVEQRKLSDLESIQVNDIEFLVDIAKKELADGKFEQSSKMFSLLVQLFPLYSPGWIGWAISEMQREEIETAAAIYDTARLLLPGDLLLLFYAAQFFEMNDKKKAIEILQTGLSISKEAAEETPLVREEMTQLLKKLQQ